MIDGYERRAGMSDKGGTWNTRVNKETLITIRIRPKVQSTAWNVYRDDTQLEAIIDDKPAGEQVLRGV